MEVKVLKVAAKRKDEKNLTLLSLQVRNFTPAEQRAFLGRSNWGTYSDCPWVQFVLQVQQALQFNIDGIQFAATIERVKFSRSATDESAKITLQVQKDICEADLMLSAMVGAKDEEGVAPLFYYCALSGEQLQAQLADEGGE
jgi:hypothetical protein